MKRNAIVVGASSGIGRALALRLARDGWTLGLTGRRVGLLEQLRDEIGAGARVQEMDVADVPAAMAALEELIAAMGGADLVVVNAGTGSVNPDLAWELEEPAIRVNVHGFAAMANVAMRHFLARGRGHLVGISSVSALRGSRYAPAYSASKAFASSYLECLWYYAAQLGLPIAVTDIQPGLRGHGHGARPVAHVLDRLAGGRGRADLRGDPPPPEARGRHPALGRRWPG